MRTRAPRAVRSSGAALLALTLAGCGVSGEPHEVDFGETFVGETSTATVAWRNPAPFAQRILGFEAGPSPEFTLAESFAGGTVAPRARTVPVRVAFRPGSEKEYAGTLSALGARGSVRLRGQGVHRFHAGALHLGDFSGRYTGRGPLDFGDVALGSQKLRTFRVTNMGSEKPLACALRWTAGAGAGFRVLRPATLPLLPKGGSAEVTVAFDAAAPGEAHAGIVIVDAADARNRCGLALRARAVSPPPQTATSA